MENKFIHFFHLVLLITLSSCNKASLIGKLDRSAVIPADPKCSPVQKNALTQSYIDGSLETIVVDEFRRNTSRQTYNLITEDHKKIAIEDSASAQKLSTVEPGKLLRIFTSDSQIQKIHEGEQPSLSIDGFTEIAEPLTQRIISNSQKVLTVLVNLTDRNTTSVFNEQQAATYMTKLSDYYKRVSNNQINLNVDADGNGSVDVETITMNTPFTGNYCRLGLVAPAEPLVKKYNPQNYNIIIYVAAHSNYLNGDDPVCRYGGVATIKPIGNANGGRSHIAVPLMSVLIHEVGHILGLGHSGQGSCTYCDQADPMGNYYGNESTAFNGVKSAQLGLYDNTSLIKTVTQSDTYTLIATGQGYATTYTSPRTLIVTSPSSNTKYYLVYRHKSGEEANMPSSITKFLGVNVHTGDTSTSGESNYLKIMNQQGANFADGKLTVELLSDISKPEAQVRITLDGTSTGGGGSGGGGGTPQCLETKILTSVSSSLQSNTNNAFEVTLHLENTNASNCTISSFAMVLSSTYLEMPDTLSVSLPSGSSKDVVVKMQLKAGVNKDLVKVATGNINMTSTDGSLKKIIPVSFNLTSGSSTCP
jgi:hypothetical protein